MYSLDSWIVTQGGEKFSVNLVCGRFSLLEDYIFIWESGLWLIKWTCSQALRLMDLEVEWKKLHAPFALSIFRLEIRWLILQESLLTLLQTYVIMKGLLWNFFRSRYQARVQRPSSVEFVSIHLLWVLVEFRWHRCRWRIHKGFSSIILLFYLLHVNNQSTFFFFFFFFFLHSFWSLSLGCVDVYLFLVLLEICFNLLVLLYKVVAEHTYIAVSISL